MGTGCGTVLRLVKHEVAGQQEEAEEAEEKRPDPEPNVGEAFVFGGDGGARQEK
jgi:hypothetical protein